MSKIEYPKKDEINKQISDILKKSEMFNQSEEHTYNYQAFAPVNKKKNIFRNAGIAAIGVAVVAAVVICVNNYDVTLKTSIEPMTSISETANNKEETSSSYGSESNSNNDSTTDSLKEIAIKNALSEVESSINETKESIGQNDTNSKTDEYNPFINEENTNLFLAAKITDDVSYRKKSFSTKINSKNNVYSALHYEYPKIYYNEELINNIELYYRQLYYQLKNRVSQETDNISEVNNNEKVINLTAECINMIAGMYSYNGDIISVIQGYKEEVSNINSDDNSVIIKNSSTDNVTLQKRSTYIYANNFNLLTGEYIALEDLFTDAKNGKRELFTEVDKQIRAEYKDNELTDAYKSGTFDKKNGSSTIIDNFNNNNYSWYFSKEGICICCNNIIDQTDLVSVTSNETYTVPYEKLSYLKDEYQKK